MYQVATERQGIQGFVTVRSLRCDTVQGFYVGRPVPAAEFAALLRTFDASPRYAPPQRVSARNP